MKARILLLARCLAFACGVVAAGAASEEDALVLYMPFEEGSGDTAYDRSGRDNHGVIHGSATWEDRGVVGKALKFDGESFIRLADGDVFGIDDEMTLSFWARNDDQPWSRWAYVFGSCDPCGYGHRQACVRWGYNSTHLQVLRCNQEGQKREPHYLRVGESDTFHFYCVVFKGAEVKVYKGGALTAEWKFKYALRDMGKKANHNLIGNGWIRGTTRALKGALDELRVYSRALSAEEIKAQFQRFSFSDYPNVLTNSSFEVAANPDWPDRWTSHRGYYFSREDYALNLDRTVSRTGDCSMRYDVKKASPTRVPYYLRYYFFFPPVEPGRYVLSAYLKTDTPGTRFTMGTADGGGWETFTLTENWKRYWLPLKYPTSYRRYAGFWPEPNQKGRVWVDDVMFARGIEPIPYAPSPKDARRSTGAATSFAGGEIAVATGNLKGPISGPPLKVDGRLDDACWEVAFRTPAFVTLKGGGAHRQTVGAVCYGPRALYVGFECDDPDLARKSPRKCRRDSLELWRDDLVEVFVDTDSTDEVYHHFVFTLAGSQWDCRTRFQKDTIGAEKFLRDDIVAWDGEWQGAASRTPHGWQAELAIPWSLFSQRLGALSDFRLNLTRTAVGEKKEYSSWSPALGSFNSPWRFACIRGLQVDWGPYRVWIDQARLAPEPTNGVYRLSLTGRNGSRAGRSMRVMLRTEGSETWQLLRNVQVPAEGEFVAHTTLDNVAPREPLGFQIRLSDGSRICSDQHFTLVPEDAMTLTTRQRVVKGEPFNAVLRINYPAEILENAALLCQVGTEENEGAAASVRFAPRRGVNSLTIPTDALPSGAAWLRTDLTRNGQHLCSRHIRFNVLPEGTQLVVMDPVKGMMINGRSFLPIGVNVGTRDYDLADLRAHGINTLLWCLRQAEIDASRKDLLERLDRFGRSGLRVVPDFTYIARKLRFDPDLTRAQRVERRIALIRRMVDTLREHEAIVGWHTMDEPRAHHPEMGELKYMTQMYQTVKQCDPLRPVSYNLGTTGLHSKHAPVSASDGVMYDYYTYPVRPDRRPMEKAQEHLRFGCRWAVETGRPLYTYIGLNGGAYPNHIRLYRPVELRCRMYLDLVEGSRGLFFFAGPPASRTLWDAFGEYAEQITALAPAWFNPCDAVLVEADSVRTRCYVGDLGDKIVVVAVNPTHRAPRVTLSLRAPYRLPDRAEAMFENRTVAINGAQIVDRFGAYGVHVYSIAK